MHSEELQKRAKSAQLNQDVKPRIGCTTFRAIINSNLPFESRSKYIQDLVLNHGRECSNCNHWVMEERQKFIDSLVPKY